MGANELQVPLDKFGLFHYQKSNTKKGELPSHF
jgi:hypothetical protein